MTNSPWLTGARVASRKLRLYCFSYAGGGAHAFSSWQSALGPYIEIAAIQLPGRGARISEPPIEALPQLIETLASVIASQDNTPFAFFGHSLGGLLAFELTRYCVSHHLPAPQRLIASGCAAPRYRDQSRQLHRLSDQALIQSLADYNGTPPEILTNHELMALLLPMIRADFGLAERYAYNPGTRLSIPITVFAGTRDQHVSNAQHWGEETTGQCQVHAFEGDHFFIHAQREAVLARLKYDLEDDIAAQQRRAA